MRREANMLKTQLGATDLSLAASAGESLLVKGIYIHNPAGSYLTVLVSRATVGYWRIGGTQGNHLYFPSDDVHHPNLLDFLFARGDFPGYPVPEGETFSLSGAEQANAIQAVLYDVYDERDQRPDSPCGPEAKDYVFTNYGAYSTTLVAGANALETPTNPVEFPAFPFGAVSPAGKRISILGIAFSDVGKTDSSQANQAHTRYLKLQKERLVLFDEDRDGLLCEGVASTSADATDVATGQNIMGGGSEVDLQSPLMFPVPLDFESNEELNVSLFTVDQTGTGSLAAADGEVCFIEHVRNL